TSSAWSFVSWTPTCFAVMVRRLKSELPPRGLLQRMLQWAAAARGRPDAKAGQLIRWLHETVRPNGTWSDRRVIVFTEYRATQNWLQTLLVGEGLASGGRL